MDTGRELGASSAGRQIDAEAALEAADRAILEERFPDAAAILEEHLIAVAGWFPDRLRSTLDRLPAPLVAWSPRLTLAHRGASSFFDQDQPLALVASARQFAELGVFGDPVGDEVLSGLGEILALRATREHAREIPVVDRGRALVEARRSMWLGIPGELRSIVLLQWGLSRMLAQDLSGAVREFQQGYWAGFRSAMPHYARNCAENAALALALVDSVDSAREWLGKARAIPQAASQLRAFVEEWEPLAEGAIALAQLELRDAEEALGRFVPAPDTHLAWGVAAYLRARLGLLDGGHFGALEMLGHQSHPRGGDVARGSIDEALLVGVEADLAIAIGRLPRAEALLERVEPGPLLTPVGARLYLAKGDATRALVQSLSGLHASVPFGRVDLTAVAAVAQLRLGRRAEAIEQFGRALELGRSLDVVAAFALLPRSDLEALVELVPAAAAHLDRVLETRPAARSHDAVVIELSQREKAVLAELARTSSTKEIAARLFVSVNTVKTQVRSVYRKLGVRSRDEALEVAHHHGFDLGGTSR